MSNPCDWDTDNMSSWRAARIKKEAVVLYEQNKQLQAENEKLKVKIVDLQRILTYRGGIEAYDKIHNLQDENEKLKRFARYIIASECWGLGVDAGDIQELVEKCGLIIKKIADCDDCNPDSDFETGDSIFVFSDILKERR